jgi:hypothetical protein
MCKCFLFFFLVCKTLGICVNVFCFCFLVCNWMKNFVRCQKINKFFFWKQARQNDRDLGEEGKTNE